MPQFRKICKVYQGYNFKRDEHTIVGFLTKLTVGGVDVKADHACKDPANKDVQAVAVLSDVAWGTGVTDAIYIAGVVSVATRQAIAQLVYTTLLSVQVDFQFTVWEYDLIKATYFPCFFSDAVLKGCLEKNGEALNMSVADDPETAVPSPPNYMFKLGLVPQSTDAQTVTIAVAESKNIPKTWGLKVG
jgi:hypothetical protein